MQDKIPHIPVLLNEVIDSFKHIQKSAYIIDATLGYAGHTSTILQNNKNINMICNDQDTDAIEFSKKRLKEYENRVVFIQDNFSKLLDNFIVQKYFKDIRGILADIGISSLQVDKKERGFSFLSDTLDMRMNQNQNFSAQDVVNGYSVLQLESIFRNFGQIKQSKKLANLIVQNRPFYSAKSLAEFIKNNFPTSKKIHPATLAFQAIRIEVNDELGELNRFLDSIEKYVRLKQLYNCTISIISFHSLEDKIIKNRFKKWSLDCICPKENMKCECGKNNSLGKIITKKPIIASDKELKINPRSRSAKLRVFYIYNLD